jgi:hypothetical protein
MANLCPTCKGKTQPPGTYRGQCHAKQSPECEAWTEDFAFTLCNACSEHMGRCAWCLGPINGGWGAEVPTTKQFCRVYENQNGIHVSGMDVGEQILVQFTVDPYSWYTWRFDPYRSSSDVSYYGFRLIMDPTNWRQATLECYVNLNRASDKAQIVFVEGPIDNPWWSRWGWTPPPSQKKPFVCSAEIRR